MSDNSKRATRTGSKKLSRNDTRNAQMRDVSTDSVKVLPCEDNISARGLFAMRDIPSGCIVARMNNAKVVPEEKKTTSLYYKHMNSVAGGDAAVTVQTLGRTLVFTSSGFSTFDNKHKIYKNAPRWYRMNHADRKNANCAIVHTMTQEFNKPPVHDIYWKSTKQIKKDDAIEWNYGIPDAAWKGLGKFCAKGVKTQ